MEGGPKEPTTPPPGQPLPIPDKVVEVAAEAYYARAAQRDDAARQRAQAAFTMVTVIAGAIAGAGLVSDITEQQTLVQVLGYAAFVAWLVSAGLLLWAAVGEYRARPHDDGRVDRGGMGWTKGNESFIRRMYSRVTAERDAIFDRLHWALLAAWLALALTAGAVGAALLSSESDQTDAWLVLSESTRETAGCPEPLPQSLMARIDPESLLEDLVTAELPPGVCGPQSVELRVPRREIERVIIPRR